MKPIIYGIKLIKDSSGKSPDIWIGRDYCSIPVPPSVKPYLVIDEKPFYYFTTDDINSAYGCLERTQKAHTDCEYQVEEYPKDLQYQ